MATQAEKPTSIRTGKISPDLIVVTTPKELSTFWAVCLTLTCFSAMVINTTANTTVSMSLSYIGADLNIEQDRLQWIVSAYALSSGCFLLPLGRLADLHGRKWAFILGTAWTGIFSLGCGFAKTEIQLDVLRGLQGIGSAATIPAGLGILAHNFPPSRRRSLAFATFSAGAPFGGGLGFVIGGVVTQYASTTWRGTFYVTTGLCTLSCLAAAVSIPADLPSPETDKRIDWVGAALVTTGLALINFVLGQGELVGWATPYIIALLIVGVFLTVAFLFWEHFLTVKTTRAPLFRLDLWTRGHGKFAAMQGIAFLEWCAFYTWVLWAQLYYLTFQNLTPVLTMVRLLPMTVTGLLLNGFVGLVVGWIDVIWLLIIGTIATGGACLLFALINPAATFWAFGFPAAVLAVFGADFIFSCGTLFVARVAHPHEQSVAGGLFQTVTQLGTSFGLAASTIVNNRVIKQQTVKAGITPDRLASNAPRQALLDGYKAAQWTGFGFAMLALIIALLFLRGVGIVGEKHAPPPDADPSTMKVPRDSLTLSGRRVSLSGSITISRAPSITVPRTSMTVTRPSMTVQRESLVLHRESLVLQRESPVSPRESPVSHRESPVSRRESLASRRESLASHRESPVLRRGSLILPKNDEETVSMYNAV